ncbi:glutamyl-tRNA reductase [Thioalkalivibrio sp. HK1]|uniref:glutamyl-tRNA reductase n=1 Tax=Thioalkalivibrio sp. HK1 TaxID=1469245 RepID=UPI000470A44A|nr:glutamyl-tRNA reductase [Thioalkalivibrio sp. HK1]
MSIIALGLSHATAPLEVREQAGIGADRMPQAIQTLRNCPGVNEAAILFTCNRTDLYCDLSGGSEGDPAPLPMLWFDRFLGIDHRRLERHLYVHLEDDAVRHVMRVASGLDSMVLGEPQILGQLKRAWTMARCEGALGTVLDRLFQRSFAVAKRIRSDTAIGKHPVSVAYAAVSLARRIFEKPEDRTALLIGAGETIELCARHLAAQGIGRTLIANRTFERARRLAADIGAHPIPFDAIRHRLADADIVITSTASPEPILKADAISKALRIRRRRPMFIADLAIPPDVEHAAERLADIYLYRVDDLSNVIEKGKQERIAAAHEAQGVIERQVGEFMAWKRGLCADSTVVQVREAACEIQKEVLKKALSRLHAGEPAEKSLEYLAHTLTRKFLHRPSVGLRSAAADDRPGVLEAATTIFGLDPRRVDPSPSTSEIDIDEAEKAPDSSKTASGS